MQIFVKILKAAPDELFQQGKKKAASSGRLKEGGCKNNYMRTLNFGKSNQHPLLKLNQLRILNSIDYEAKIVFLS